MTLQEYKEKKMKDPEFAKAYVEVQLEMNVIWPSLMHVLLMILTQKERAE